MINPFKHFKEKKRRELLDELDRVPDNKIPEEHPQSVGRWSRSTALVYQCPCCGKRVVFNVEKSHYSQHSIVCSSCKSRYPV